MVHETLRLYPPAVISARKVARDLSFDGRCIRAGRTLVFSPYVTHRLPGLWPDPLRFDATMGTEFLARMAELASAALLRLQ